MNGVDRAIQDHLDRLIERPSVKLALFCFHPSLKAQEFRFCASPDYADCWETLETWAAKFRTDGCSAQLDEIVPVNGANHHLIATTNGLLDRAPFIIGLVLGSPAEALSATTTLADIASDCTGESYSIKWK